MSRIDVKKPKGKPVEVVYLDKDFNIVPEELSVLVKVRYADGTVVFGFKQ